MMNWLVIIATVGVFWLQIVEAIEQAEAQPQPQPDEYQFPLDGPRTLPEPNAPAVSREAAPLPLATFVLDGWRLKGLLGYMWLHGGLLHLLGNMWFLWVFGNAVCAKVGNLRYLLLYVLLGVAAGVAHLLTSSGTAVGASGAINGIVGMYLVLFPQNDITCYWSPIIIYWRRFTLSSFWIILIWLSWDIIGAFFLSSGSNVAYFAHLGGFGAGFAIAVLMCHRGWLRMERYERSLLQIWQERKQRGTAPSVDPTYRRLALESRGETPHQDEPIPTPTTRPKPVPRLDIESGEVVPVNDDLLRATCSCGQTVEASRQYGGKVVRCPACKGRIVMPETIAVRPPAAAIRDGHIRFACACGMPIKVPVRHAGRWGRCPRCTARIRVPDAGNGRSGGVDGPHGMSPN